MVVGFVALELHLPSSRSLKEKRRVVKSLVERLHQRHRVSVAETAHHDLLQRAEIGIAAVASDAALVERLFDELRAVADAESEAVVTRWDVQLLEETS
jgi:uncharacterized protein YlxP (DUF503 family)